MPRQDGPDLVLPVIKGIPDGYGPAAWYSEYVVDSALDQYVTNILSRSGHLSLL
jgi:hypothetical protein